jgi:hypothetical protein
MDGKKGDQGANSCRSRNYRRERGGKEEAATDA